MEYFAGFFDAEGYISLVRAGNFVIGIEQTDEAMAKLLKATFNGNIYVKKRDNRKVSYDWKIATNIETALNFLEKIRPYSIVKRHQLDLIYEYINLRRTERKEKREEYISKIVTSRVPNPTSREIMDDIEPSIKPNKAFYKWLAGFFDGDGCFSCSPSGTKFNCWIGCHSSYPECIIHIQNRITGNITHVNGAKNTVWKWVCKGQDVISFCKKISPHLVIKKQQSLLCIDFKSASDREVKNHIISQIKHLNR